jgi:transcriptional regulator
MYNPPAFQENRLETLHAAIAAAPLANLIAYREGDGLLASPVPLMLDPEPAPFGTLIGHLARGNPLAAAEGAMALAIFMGPDAYITPSWYATKRATGRVVPTWNYVTLHAHGTLRFFDDPARLLALVRRLTERHERQRAAPWAVGDAPADFIAGQLKGIVGFVLPIERLEGKWKMSQNRPEEDRAGVVEGLKAEGRADVAALIGPPSQNRAP